MVEWVLKLSAAERWLYGFALLLLVGWIVQRINHSLAIHRERRKQVVEAATAFRAVIDIDAVKGFKGHQLWIALLRPPTIIKGVTFEGEFFKHKRAVQEFRVYLGSIDKLRLDKAWHQYCCDDEDNPDFFYTYCVPEDGPEKLVKRLEALKTLANKR